MRTGRRRGPVVLAVAAIGLFAAAAPCAGQEPVLKGSVAAGVTLGRAWPVSDVLTTRTAVRPTVRRLPSRGLGVAFALNWFDADVNERFIGTDGPFGGLTVRPIMFGAAYTVIRGRLAIAPSLVGGPALSSLKVDERLQGAFGIGGNAVEEHAGSISAAVRSGVTVTYALAPRLGLTAFGGYLWHRPAFLVRTPAGDHRQRLRADVAVVDVGLIVALF